MKNGTPDGHGAKRAVGDRKSGAAGSGARDLPDPELVEKAKRRRFSARYKLRILQEAEACTKHGELGALLRREGLYTSHLSAWRKQRDEGALQALGKSRGRPKPNPDRSALKRWPRRSAIPAFRWRLPSRSARSSERGRPDGRVSRGWRPISRDRASSLDM